jgi:hypothetical protein
MSAICPCCKQPIAGQPDLVELVKQLPFGPVARQILGLIAAGGGAVVPSNDIAFEVYGKNPPNGMNSAVTTVHVTLHKLRDRLKEHGLELVTKMGRGGGYSLRWLGDDKLAA